MGADILATQGDIASATVILTILNRDNSHVKSQSEPILTFACF